MSRQILQINNAIIWHEITGIVSLYDANTGEFHTLNETGSKIWILAAAGEDRKSIISKMVDDFSGNDNSEAIRILTDVKVFLSNVVERGWIDEHST